MSRSAKDEEDRVCVVVQDDGVAWGKYSVGMLFAIDSNDIIGLDPCVCLQTFSD
jgi:hypothetical protein